jgi:hypothetical protein
MGGTLIPELHLPGKNPFIPERLDVEKFVVDEVSGTAIQIVNAAYIPGLTRSPPNGLSCSKTTTFRDYGTSVMIAFGCQKRLL